MIIKGKNKVVESRRDWSIPILLILLVCLLGVSVLRSGIPKQSNKTLLTVHCGAERVENGKFVEEGHTFDHGSTQSSKLAMKGKYACELDSQMYGMSYILHHPKPGTTYRATVWRRGDNTRQAYLKVKEVGSGLEKKTNHIVEKKRDYWGKLELIFTIPTYRKVSDLEVLVLKEKGSGLVYFDELTIEEISPKPIQSIPGFKEELLKARIDSKDLEKFDRILDRSKIDGIYIRQKGDEAKVKIIAEGKGMPAKMRFKGDWLDHLHWKGKSYRIKLKSGNTWRGMSMFSVQRAEVRGNLREWVYHALLRYEDVLSPRYDFIHFQINGGAPKIYAYEEHFTKHLLEHHKRREGPILKFNENRFWEGMKRSFDLRDGQLADWDNKVKAFWSSEILPFEMSKIAKRPTLSKNFDQAKNLMYEYKYNLRKPIEIFDLERMAKYIAISELTMAFHALTWHNERYYYNPITNLLEPIGYDGFGSEDIGANKNTLYTIRAFTPDAYSYEPIQQLFKDPTFLKVYFKTLSRIADRTYVASFLSQLEEGITAREKFIRQGMPDYHYNRDEIQDHVRTLQMKMWPFDNSLQVYTKKKTKDSLYLSLINYHELPIEVFVKGDRAHSIIVYPQKQTSLPEYHEWAVRSGMKSLAFALPGTERVKTADIMHFPPPLSVTARQKIRQESQLPDGVTTRDSLILIKGKTTIKKPLYIPAGKKLKVIPGAHIRFLHQGSILSESPIFFQGTREKPILVESVDGEGGALVVLQCTSPSKLSYTTFKNQNTLNYKGWQLSGALTFFESNIEANHIRIESNHCEDALNVVKSRFEIDSCRFSNTKSDAFDADFCTGHLKNSTFKNTGNDAIDFSTSTVTIEDCTMQDIGDKGISVGEHSSVRAARISIEGAVIGIASKDLSEIEVRNIQLKDCATGFAAYQKKPEFGPAHIRCENYSLEEVKRFKLIEDGSTFKELHN